MADETFSLSLDLYSSNDNTLMSTDILFESFPKSFREISSKIETLFSIPVCVQNIFVCYPDYSHHVVESDTLESLYIRSGDLLQVCYPTQAECEEVRYAKNILFIIVETVDKLLKMADGPYDCCIGMKFVTTYMLNNTVSSDKLAMSLSPFYPWTDLAHVNKLFFASLGGIELLLQFYELVLQFRKKELTLEDGEMFEVISIHTLSSFTGSGDFSHLIANQRCLELFLDTFLWVPVDSEQATDTHKAAIQAGLQAICNILVPDHYAELDRSHDVIVQSIAVCMTPVYKCKTAIVSMMLLTCMTYCCELSIPLLPRLFTSVLSIVDFRRKAHPNETAAIAVIEAYAGTIFSLLIVSDVHTYQDFDESILQQITELLEKVCDTDPEVVRSYEMNTEFFWGSSLPSLSTLYRPASTKTQELSPVLEKLVKVCVQTLIHILRIILGRHCNMLILLNEDLQDYLQCLPWIVPSHARSKAVELVQEVGKIIPIQPLTLLSLARAKIAKEEYGLYRVLRAITISDLLYP